MDFASGSEGHMHMWISFKMLKISNYFLTKCFSKLTGKDSSIHSVVLLQIKSTGFLKLLFVTSLLSHTVTFCSYVLWLWIAAPVVLDYPKI